MPQQQQLRPHAADPRRAWIAVRVLEASSNRKLAPLEYQSYRSATLGRTMMRPVPRKPFCASTYVAIEPSCPASCRFKHAGCYVRAGFTGRMSNKLDAIAEEQGLSGLTLMHQQVSLLAECFGGRFVPQDGGRHGTSGRDLRLHVGGDVSCALGAALLARAALDWRARRGGAVWLYTHRWAHIRRSAFGTALNVLASVESPADANDAIRRGYVPAIVVDSFPSRRAFTLPGLRRGWKVLPCPAETHKRTCVECRLCLDVGALRQRRQAIGFQLHGQQRNKVRLPLVRQQALPLEG